MTKSADDNMLTRLHDDSVTVLQIHRESFPGVATGNCCSIVLELCR